EKSVDSCRHRVPSTRPSSSSSSRSAICSDSAMCNRHSGPHSLLSWRHLFLFVFLLPPSTHSIEPSPSIPPPSYAYARPTPFSPYYRPECDLIFPASYASTHNKPPHQTIYTTTSLSAEKPYYDVPPSHLSPSHSSSAEPADLTNELLSEFDLTNLY